MLVVTAAITIVGGGGGGDIICLGVILPSYVFVLGDRKWNWAPTAINDARWNLLKKEDLLWKGLKRKEK